MSEGDAVKVCLRVRPLIHREQGEQVNLVWKAENNTLSQVDGTRSFHFDRVFHSHETTSQVYQEVAVPIIRSALQGYNGTIFAYGQTSSGKTYTMMGTPDNLGIIPQAIQEVFRIIQEIPNREFLLRVSYMEIYNETVTDLLCDDRKKKPLEIREDINRNVYVADLTEELVMVPEHVLQWIKKGEKNRHYGETKMNDHSSRSHTIFRMIVESRERNDPGNSENCDGAVMVSHLNLVDLAGSERASQTGAEGVRFKEGCNINRSLFILGQVMKKLSDGQAGGFINYRDSKLTRILQNSLGGNTKTVIICTITPVSFDETLSTLQFASTAKHVRNTPHVNEVLDDQALLKRYRKEIMDLKKQLEELEASSEIKTQAMAKEEHSQLLTEIKQLQKEREDRIWNLTNIVVASSQQSNDDQRVKRKRRVTWAPGKLKDSLCTVGISPFEIGSKLNANFTKRPKISEMSSIAEIDDSLCAELSDFDDVSRILDDAQDADWTFGSKVTRRDRTTALSHSMIDFSESTSTLTKEISLQKCKEMEQKVSELEDQLHKLTKEYDLEVGKRESLEKETTELKQQLQSQDKREMSTLELEITGSKDQLQSLPEDGEQSPLPADHLEVPEELTPLKTDIEQANGLSISAQIEEDLDPFQEQLSNHIHDLCREQIQMLELKIADLEGYNDQNDLRESLQICEALMAEKQSTHEELAVMKINFDHLVADNESLKKEVAYLEECLKEKSEKNEFDMLEEQTQEDHEAQLIHEISSLKKLVENAEVYNQELENELENKSKLLKEQEKIIAELKKESEIMQKKVDYSDLTASMGDSEKMCEEVFNMRQSLCDAETVTRDSQREAAFLRSENMELKEQMDELSMRCEKREKDASDYEKQLEIEKSNFKRMQTDLQKELQYAYNEINQINGLMAGKVPKDLLSRVELDKKVDEYSKQLASLLEEKTALQQEVDSLSKYKSLPSEVEHLKDQVQRTSEELILLKNEKEQSDSMVMDLKQKLLEKTEQIEKLTEEATHVQAKCQQAEQQYAELKMLHESLQERCSLTAEALNKKDTEEECLLKEMDKLKQCLESMEQKLSAVQEEKDEAVRAKQELETGVKELEELLKSSCMENETLQGQVKNLSCEVTTLQQQTEKLSELHKEKQDLEERYIALVSEKEQLQEQLHVCSLNVMQAENTEPSSKLQELQEELKLAVQNRDELLTKVEDLTAEKVNLQQDLNENIELVQRTSEELILLKNEKEQSDSMVMDLKQKLLEKTEQIEKLTEEATHVQAKCQQAEQQYAELKMLHESLQERCSLTAEALNKKDTEEECLLKEMDKLKQCLESMEQKLSAVQEEKDEAVRAKQELETGVKELEELLKSSCMENETLQGQVKNLSCEVTTLQQQTEKLSELHKEKQDLEERYIALVSEKEQLQEQLHVCSLNVMQAENTEPSSKLQELQEELKLAVQNRDELLTKVEDLTAEKVNLQQDLNENIELSIETQDELRATQEELKQHKQLVADLRKQLADCAGDASPQAESQRNDLEEKLSAMTEKLQESKEQYETLTNEKMELERVHQSLVCEMTHLQECMDSAERALSKAEEENNELKQKIEEQQKSREQDELTNAHLQETENLEGDLNRQVKQVCNVHHTYEIETMKEQLNAVQKQLNDPHSVEDVNPSKEVHGSDGYEEQRHEFADMEINLVEEKVIKNPTLLEEMQGELLGKLSLLQEELQKEVTHRDELQCKLESVLTENARLKENLDSVLASEDDVKSLQLQEKMLATLQEKDLLLESLNAITAERDQLKVDLQENIEMSIETQEELRSALNELKVKTQLLESLNTRMNEKEVGENEKLNDSGDLLKQDCEKYLAQLEVEKSNRTELQHEVEEKNKKIEELETQLEDILRNFQETESKYEIMAQTLELVTKERDHLTTFLTVNGNKQTKEQEIQVSEMLINIDGLNNTIPRLLEEAETERNQLKETLVQLQHQLHFIFQEKGELQQIIDNLKTERCELMRNMQKHAENEALRSKEESELKNEIETMKEQLNAVQKQLNDPHSVEDVNPSKEVHGLDGYEEQRHEFADMEINLVEEKVTKNPTLLEEMQGELLGKLSLLQEELQKEVTHRDELQCKLESVLTENARLKENLDSVLASSSRTQEELQRCQEELNRQIHLVNKLNMETSSSTSRDEKETTGILPSLEEEASHFNNEDLEVLKMNLKNSEAELEMLRIEKYDSEQKVNHLKQQVETITEESENLKMAQQCLVSERDKLQEDLKKNAEKFGSLQEEALLNANLHEELVQRKEELEKGQMSLKCKIESLLKALKEAQSTLESLQKEKLETEQQLSTLQQQMNGLTQERDELKTTEERSTLEMSSLKENMMNTEEDQLKTPENEEARQSICNHVLDNNLKDLEAELESLREEKSDIEEKLFSLQQHLESMVDERDELKVRLQSLLSERDHLKEDLRDNVDMSIETQDDLIKAQADLQQQKQRVEELICNIASLEEKSSTVEKELQQTVSLLKEANSEREVLEQSKQKLLLELEHLHNDIKNKEFEKEKERSEASKKIADLTVQLKTVSDERDQMQLTKEELQKRFSETQDVLKQSQEELHQQKQRVEKLTTDISVLTEKYSSLETELKEKVHTLDKAVQETQNFDQSKQGLTSEMEQIMEDLKSKDSDLTQTKKEKEAASQIILELTSKMKCITQERDDLKHSNENLEEEAKQLREEIQQLKHEHTVLTSEHVRKTCQLDELETELQQLQEKMHLSDASTKQLVVDNIALQKETQQYDLQMASLRQEQEQFQQLLQRARSEKENICANLQDQEKAVARLQGELVTSQAKLQTMQQQCDESNAHLMEKVNEVNDMLKEISSLQDQMQQLHQEVKEEKMKNHDLCEKVDLLEKEIQVLRLIQSEPTQEEDELAERTEILEQKNQEWKELMVNISTVYSDHHNLLNNISSDLQSETEAQKQSMSAIKESLSSTLSRAFGNLQTEHIKLNSQMQTLLNKFKVVYRNAAVKDEYYSFFKESESELCAVQKKNDELLLQCQSLEQHGAKWSESSAEELKFCELEFMNQLIMRKIEVMMHVGAGFSEVQVALNSMEIDLTEEIKCKREFSVWLEEFKGLHFDAKNLNDGVSQENRRIADVIQHLTKKLRLIAQSKTKQDTMMYLNSLKTELQEKKEKNKELLQRLQQIAPSGDSNVLEEENARLRETLKNVQAELKKMQCRIQDLENELSSAKADAKRKEQKALLLEDELHSSTAESQLSEMQDKIAEKEKNIQTALKEIKVLQEKVAKGAAPYTDEIDSLKNQVVRVEMERMKLSKAADRQIASLKACIEDRETCLRKLKEQLRRTQKDGDTTISSENSNSSQYPLTCGGGSGIVQSTAMLMLQSENAALKREITQYKKKCHQLSRNISSCEDELKKQKGRSSDTPSTPLSSSHHDEVMSYSKSDLYKMIPASPKKSEMPIHHVASPGKTGIHKKRVLSPAKIEMHKTQPMSPIKMERHSVPVMSPGNTGRYRKRPASPLKTEGPLFSALPSSPCNKKIMPEKDLPNDKFFDVRAKSLPYCPSKFFDNSCLGTLPETDSYAGITTETSDINNWWDRAGKNENPNDCKTS